ncbi:MAG: ABC transporter permease [Saprospiraceae bacterium]
MLKNYLKIAWRNLLNNKSMFGINVLGLTIGLATCLIITLFVVDELSYDRFNEKADQIVRVYFHGKLKDEIINEQTIMAPVAAAFKRDFPEVQDVTRIGMVKTNTKVILGDHAEL